MVCISYRFSCGTGYFLLFDHHLFSIKQTMLFKKETMSIRDQKAPSGVGA
jgi:hypothetical protein